MTRRPAPPARPRPPRACEWLMTRLFPDGGACSPAGDLGEEFVRLAGDRGAARARLWYRGQVLRALPCRLSETVLWRATMFENHLKIAWRQMTRQRTYSAINVAGLAIGMAAALLIVLWVRDEMSFDRFNRDREDVYRVTALFRNAGGFGAPAPLAPAAAAEIPEVAEAARTAGIFGRVYLRAGDRAFYEDGGLCADASLFRIFTFPLVRGTAEDALSGPGRMLVSRRLARKYFGAEDPVGRTLLLDGRWPLTVGGVMADVPRTSHLRFDFVLPIAFAEAAQWWGMDWGDFNFKIYLRARPGADPKALAAKLNAVAAAHRSEPVIRGRMKFDVQRLDDVYLNPVGPYDMALGDKRQVALFATIALFIALIAGINFVNLATARAEKRSREIALRKVVGAARRQVAAQLFAESSLVTLFALGLALVLARLAMPVFNGLTGKPLTFRLLDPGVLLGLGAVTGIVGLLAGAFPALYLSSFRPAETFKARSGGRTGAGSLRRVLVVAQFAISIALVLATVVVLRQLRFIREKSGGAAADAVLYVPVKGALGARYEAARTALLAHPGIAAVGAKDCLPTQINNNTTGVGWEGKAEDQKSVSIETLAVDAHYLEAMGLRIVAGRGFSDEFTGDAGRAFVLNEEAVRQTGLRDPVGKTFRFRGAGPIVGIVEDSFFQSFRQALRPQAYYLFRDLPAETADAGVVLIRARGGAEGRPLREVAAHVERVWREINPSTPFELGFLDDAVAAQYAGERRQGRLFGTFAALAIFVSCLGLFGLASFTAERRTKEIGIRKALGASAAGICALLSRDFTRAVVAANLLAWPAAALGMTRWLRGFSSRAPLPLWIFPAAGGAALLLAWLTVALQTIRSARTDPVDALHYE